MIMIMAKDSLMFMIGIVPAMDHLPQTLIGNRGAHLIRVK